MMSTVARGRRAEDAASDYLASRGWQLLARNHRTPVGELDLVFREEDTVVVVEVKARSGDWFGEALESIGPKKQRRLRAAAGWWLAETGRVGVRTRFDVVVVSMEADGTLRDLSHLSDVLGPGR